jgi:hypothetical protein
MLVNGAFPCPITSFLVKYLGLPLSMCKLPKSTLLTLVDQMVDRLPAWKSRLMHRSGRLSLIKSTLATIPVYTTMSQELSTWLLRAFKKNFKGFLWIGMEVIHEGSAWWHGVGCNDHLILVA